MNTTQLPSTTSHIKAPQPPLSTTSKTKMITIVKRPLTPSTVSAFKDVVPIQGDAKKAKTSEEQTVNQIKFKVPSASVLGFPASARPLPVYDSYQDPHRAFVRVMNPSEVNFVRYRNYAALALRVATEEGRHEDARWCQTVAFCRSYVADLFYDKDKQSSEQPYSMTAGAYQRFEDFAEACRNQARASKIDLKACESVIQSLKLYAQTLADPREETMPDFEANYAAKVASDVVYLRYVTTSKVFDITCHGRDLMESFEGFETFADEEIATTSNRPLVSPKDIERYCYGENPGTNDIRDLERYAEQTTGHKGMGAVVRLFLMLKKRLHTTGAKRMAERFFEEMRRYVFVCFDEMYPRVSYYGYIVPGEYVSGLTPPHRYVPNVGENDGKASDFMPKSLLDLLGVKKSELELDDKVRSEGVDFFAMPGSASTTAGMGIPFEKMMPSLWLDHLNAYLCSLPRNYGGGKGLTLPDLPWYRSFKILKHREYASRLPYLPKSPMEMLNFMFWLPDPKNVRVVIIGEGAYPNKDHACGVAFSTPPDYEGDVPASEGMIFSAICEKVRPEWVSEETKTWKEIGGPNVTCLKRWCDQGVLLINASLNVIESSFDPNEHPDVPFKSHKPKDMGTTTLMTLIVDSLGHRDNDVVFLVYGEDAKMLMSKCSLPRGDKKLANTSRVFFAPHPSPRGGNTVGFLENCGFEEANKFLMRRGQKPILW